MLSDIHHLCISALQKQLIILFNAHCHRLLLLLLLMSLLERLRRLSLHGQGLREHVVKHLRELLALGFGVGLAIGGGQGLFREKLGRWLCLLLALRRLFVEQSHCGN